MISRDLASGMQQKRSNRASRYYLISMPSLDDFFDNGYHSLEMPQYLYTQATSRCAFRISERIMIETHLFIHGCSLKKRGNEEHVLLRDPQRAGLETFYASLLI